jgi:hypothetical protein
MSTLVTAWFSIGENHARDIYERELPEFKAIHKTRVDADAALKATDFSDYRRQRRSIIRTYNTEYDRLLGKMGIKNSFHKFLDLKGHQQIKVGLTVATVTGIALGATYSLLKDKKLSEDIKLQEHNSKIQVTQR